jgi:dienelactone hydrolase
MDNAEQSTRRVTRSSTRTQTREAHADAKAKQKPARTKGTGRIEKQRLKPSARPSTVKPKLKARSRRAAGREESDEKLHPPTSGPDNISTHTIYSDLVKNPITCHQYASTTPTPLSAMYQPPLIFTHGAGGTLLAPAVTNFLTGFTSPATGSTVPVLAFQGSMNLGARVKGFQACHAELLHRTGNVSRKASLDTVMYGGRSMGARAAVMAGLEYCKGNTQGDRGKKGNKGKVEVKLVLVSYPLKGPKDVRDQILLELPEEVEVLFIIGGRDAMCPLELLDEVRSKMVAKSRLAVVRGADHGMNVKPAKFTKEVGEETGSVAARWLNEQVRGDDEVIYVGAED